MTRRTLDDARLYLVAGARIGDRPTAELVPGLARAGVDVLQLREKNLEAGDILRAGAALQAACDAAGVPFIVNDRPDLAALLGAGVHVGQNDVPVADARRFVSREQIVGLSTHARAEIDAVCESQDPPDYVAVGPVFTTPTKPGRPAAGVELIEYAAARLTIPWFAIGGIDETTLDHVLAAGARRIVVVRAITEAPDPAGAARTLRTLLERAPL